MRSLVLVLVGGRRPVRVSQSPHEAWGDQDRHEAPTLPRIDPLSLQDAGERTCSEITRFGWQSSSGRRGADVFWYYPIRLAKFIRDATPLFGTCKGALHPPPEARPLLYTSFASRFVSRRRVSGDGVGGSLHINDNEAYVVLAAAIQRCLDKHCADL
jgi:hypothetical protein